MSTSEGPFPRSEMWRGVDSADDPGFFVAYLDQAAANLEEIRREAIRSLEVKPGCSLLDVGSGAGEFLIDVARRVGGVRAVGIDASDVMVNTATERAISAGVDVAFARGDAGDLDFPDGSFDRVNCSRVLVHLEDPAAVVSEMARVLATGGRLAIVEPDHDALIIDSDDLTVSRAVRRQLTAALRNPDIGRRLRRLLIDSGLEVLEVSGRAIPLPRLRVALEQFRLFDRLGEAVVAGDVDPETARRWRAWIEEADATGRLLMCAVLFRVLATKPG